MNVAQSTILASSDGVPRYGSAHHVRLGLRHRIPPCCIAVFTIDMARGRLPYMLRGQAGHGYVPCGVFHPKGETPWL